MALTKKLTKIGNSSGVILPSEILKVVGIEEDTEIQISIKDHQIILEPIRLKDHRIMKTFMGVLQDYNETFKKLAQ